MKGSLRRVILAICDAVVRLEVRNCCAYGVTLTLTGVADLRSD